MSSIMATTLELTSKFGRRAVPFTNNKQVLAAFKLSTYVYAQIVAAAVARLFMGFTCGYRIGLVTQSKTDKGTNNTFVLQTKMKRVENGKRRLKFTSL